MENSTAIDIGITEVANSDSVASDSKEIIQNEEQTETELGSLSTSIAGSSSATLNSASIHDSSADMSCHGDENNGDENDDDDGCYVSDYDDNDDYMFENDVDDDENDNDDDYLNMQAQFDNVDLPPGVEASVSWIKNSTSMNVSKDSMVPPSGSGSGSEGKTSLALVSDMPNFIHKNIGSSSSTFHVGSSSDGKKEGVKEHEDALKDEAEKEGDVMKNYECFKRFDTVNDFVDHHYSAFGFGGQQPPKAWTKKIHDEWKMLENGLPETIFVRVYETRMDLLRAIIIGPAGTPYHDGLFVFDVLFPPTYPDIPPMVYYYSGGLRLNPNLYDCGKVCLSLLNTWTGEGNEKWIPNSSTMLQVLVSIQALILNEEPFFNEPGYDGMYIGETGRQKSKEYTENAFIMSLKTMMYTLRRPPKHFEDFVAGYFRTNARHILLACKAYMEGAVVGSLANNDQAGCSLEFKDAVARMMNGLVLIFLRNGSKDCEEFRNSG
ncbi:Ubiquitin-conjugating enzyme like [Heracleum sosnowskyi]|uniref:E2 ubiquitin-conjugating enzyme n=1 Tax=Heracleum sosnowskyi TaxID=360622 RepID=A0AAD8JJ03_9APIA|nr:Ubiquitin-conjugating enzyme like [Heracleum sosnowskyi]